MSAIRKPHPQVHQSRLVLFACLIACAAAARPATAAPVSALAGYEFSQGAHDQTTRGAFAAAGVRFGGAQANLAGLRFDDSVVGMGSGVTAGLGVPLLPTTSLLLQGSRYLGDGSYRAWRTRVGPQFAFPRGAQALLAWSHYEDNLDTRSDGAVLESSMPLAAGLAARLNASVLGNSDGSQATAASAGLSFTLVPHLEVLGDVGLTKNGGMPFAQPAPSPLGGLLGGGKGSRTTAPSDEIAPAFLLGVHVSLP